MKKLFTLLAASLAVLNSVSAQKHFVTNPSLTEKQKKSRLLINKILQQQSVKHTTEAKPTAIKQRVVAQVFNNGLDSFVYKYSGNRGSVCNHNNVYYDNGLYSTEFSAEPMFYQGYHISNSSDVLADSIIEYSNGEVAYKSYAVYNSNYNLDSFGLYQYNEQYFEKNYAHYDSQGRIDTLLEMSGDNAIADDIYKSIYVYNSDGYIIADSIYKLSGVPLLEEVDMYYYNDDNLLDSFTSFYADENDNYVIKVSHYPNGYLKTLHTYTVMDGLQTLEVFDSFGYESGIEYATYIKEESYNQDGELVYGTLLLKYPSASGNPDSATISNFDNEDGWQIESKFIYHYNNFENPDTLTVMNPDGSDIRKAVYYYEEYDDNTSINNLADNKDFAIYPNPFSDYINIEYKSTLLNGNATIQLTDLSGRQIYKHAILLGQESTSIAIPTMSTGTYIFTLQDATGKLWSTKLVRK